MNDEATCKCPTGMPAWVMTFADLMSLLLAFFVLLFSFSEMDKNIYKELAGSLKEAFGLQREIKAKEAPKGINIIAREFSPGTTEPTVTNQVRQHTTDDYKRFPVVTKSTSGVKENSDRNAKQAISQKAEAGKRGRKHDREAALRTQIEKDSQKLNLALKKEISEGLIELEVKDKRIILRIREKASFPSGSSSLIEPFRAVTGKISRVFQDFDGEIIVSGHTDNLPISTSRYRSNWELSASRAVSVIHALSRNPVLSRKRFEIAAYADTQPVDTNDTAAGRARNRRVEIMLDYTDSSGDVADTSGDGEQSAYPVSDMDVDTISQSRDKAGVVTGAAVE